MGELAFPYGEGTGIAIGTGYFAEHLIEQLYLLNVDASDHIAEPGKTVSGVIPVKRTLDIHLTDWDYGGEWSAAALLEVGYDVKQMDADIGAGISDLFNDYSSVIHPGTDHVFDTGYLMQRYKQNDGYYKPHVDGNAACALNRLLTVIVYLNDVEEGGETNFPRQRVAVKPVAGTAVLFPANFLFLHEGCVPLSGDKFILNTFLEPAAHTPGDPNT